MHPVQDYIQIDIFEETQPPLLDCKSWTWLNFCDHTFLVDYFWLLVSSICSVLRDMAHRSYHQKLEALLGRFLKMPGWIKQWPLFSVWTPTKGIISMIHSYLYICSWQSIIQSIMWVAWATFSPLTPPPEYQTAPPTPGPSQPSLCWSFLILLVSASHSLLPQHITAQDTEQHPMTNFVVTQECWYCKTLVYVWYQCFCSVLWHNNYSLVKNRKTL